MTFTVNVDLSPAQALLSRIERGTANFAPLYTDLAAEFESLVEASFASETGQDERRWQPNAASTLERFERHLKGRKSYYRGGKFTPAGQKMLITKKILQGVTGNLRQYVWYHATKDMFQMGSSPNTKAYAAIHQFGGPFKAFGKQAAQMPARPFMPIDKNGKLYPKAQRVLRERVKNYVDQLLAGNLG